MRRLTDKQDVTIQDIKARAAKHRYTFYRPGRTHDSLVKHGICHLLSIGGVTVISLKEQS